MNTPPPLFSAAFRQLYCDAAVFNRFSTRHPVSFHHVLPLLTPNSVVDDPQLLAAEAAHLASRTDTTRQAVVLAHGRRGLLLQMDATNLKPVVDCFGADFFELMGDGYLNAGAFICALRWYREFIIELESQNPGSNRFPDPESVYASVGYCLYSLGLFEETIAWTKSCAGPQLSADVACRALIDQETQLLGGRLRAVERSANRTRYTVSVSDPAQAERLTPQLKLALKTLAPFQESYLAWISSEGPLPEIEPGGYPFQPERDSGNLMRHRLNLLYATAGQADTLLAQGQPAEAKRLLQEAAILEPRADFIQERLQQLP